MKSRTFLLGLLVALSLGLPLNAQQGPARPAAQSTVIVNSGPFNGSTGSIAMRDGRLLAADIFLPKSGGKHPVVLIQTPYDKNLVRPWFAGEGRWGPDSLFTDANYAFVVTNRCGRVASPAAIGSLRGSTLIPVFELAAAN